LFDARTRYARFLGEDLKAERPLTARSPAETAEAVRINAPTRGNVKLEALLAAVNADDQLKGWWHVAQVNADRLGMSDHSWIHVQIVLNIGLRLLRLLQRKGVETAIEADHKMKAHDAEIVVAAGCLLHDIGMAIHRTDHEAYSLFLAAEKLNSLFADVYQEPERAVVVAESLHAIIGHRRRGEPLTLEAGVVRVADALDMAEGRSRVPFEGGRQNIHSLSAAAIEKVTIDRGEEGTIRIEIEMNNSAGIFQVDELLATKLRGSGLEDHLEVIARIDAEHEKRLLPVFRI
jgi:metal-dependent HD superfamily phosphatase/phosphodiesterase